ncbi:MAG: hypothetical protein KDB74_06485 [Flavobacteriales bacterium]|nr:hypothetical protein [Flavobacteriales bacterium]
MNQFKNIVNTLVYGNFVIALCASSLCYFTILFFSLELYLLETVLFVFFSTQFTYIFHRKVDHLYYGNRFLTPQDNWIKQHDRLYSWLLIMSFVGSFYFYYQLPKATIVILFPLILISLLYVIKLNFFGKSTSLRLIPFLKPFLIAFVWGGIASFLPLIINGGMEAFFELKYHIYAIAMGLFVFGQTIPFDIRDYEIDKKSNLKTLPHALGNGITKLISISAYGLALVFVYIVSKHIDYQLVALASAFIISMVIIWKLSSQKSDLHFSLLHESSLALPLICFKILAFF